MKALVLEGTAQLALRDVAEPERDDGDVLVRVEWSGVCGTDVHGYAQGPPLRHPPVVMGHEFCGEVVGTGARVVVNPRVVCGACDHCSAGREQRCRSAATLGVDRPGGFAEVVAVPERNCVLVPEDLPPALAALTEPLAVGLHGANVLDDATGLDGARVAVVGGGVVGLAVALVAQQRRAKVTLVDVSRARREQALRHGIARASAALVGDFDITVEAVGSRAAREASVGHTAVGGVSLWIGLDTAPATIDVTSLVRGERSILTSFCYTHAEFVAALELCGVFAVGELEAVELAEGPQVFARLGRGSQDSASARTLFALGAP